MPRTGYIRTSEALLKPKPPARLPQRRGESDKEYAARLGRPGARGGLRSAAATPADASETGDLVVHCRRPCADFLYLAVALWVAGCGPQAAAVGPSATAHPIPATTSTQGASRIVECSRGRGPRSRWDDAAPGDRCGHDGWLQGPAHTSDPRGLAAPAPVRCLDRGCRSTRMRRTRRPSAN